MKGLWWTRLLDFISPRQCVVCSRRLAATERTLCAPCLLHLPRTAYQFDPADNEMARLFWHLVPAVRVAALTFYTPQSETAGIVYDMKYRNRPDVGEDMGRLMAREMLLAGFFDGIDVLLPVPLSRQRRRQRGYNQSEQLARGISAVTRLPVVDKALVRKHFRQSQTRLNRQERQQNVRDMFVLRDASLLRDRHVLLVDDVCTTGATLTACADALRGVDGIRISMLTYGFTKS